MTAPLWALVEEVRRAYEDAGWRKVRKTHVVLDESIDNWNESADGESMCKRTVASCLTSGKTIYLSPRIETFDDARKIALLAHEFGHAVQGFYGDRFTSHDAIERDADSIAEEVLGLPLYYAPVPGDACERLIQTFNPKNGVRPRPKGLRL